MKKFRYSGVIAMVALGTTSAFAQAPVGDFSITASPPQVQGVNEVDTLVITWTNASLSVSPPAGTIKIQMTMPTGVNFSATPPTDWSYDYYDVQNITITNTSAIPVFTIGQYIKIPVTVTPIASGTSDNYTVELSVMPNPAWQNNPAVPTQFYGAVVVPGSPLPIELSDFTAKLNDKQMVDLNWITQTEINNKGFDIERSNNGKDFRKIGYVTSKAIDGNSTAKLVYTSEDLNPVIGDNYYRLKEVSMDGKATYSVVRKVTIGRGQLISLYPNPANSFVNIKGLQDGDVIRVYDIAGKVILEKKAAASQLMQIDVSGIANGNYQIAVFNNDERVFIGKLVKHD